MLQPYFYRPVSIPFKRESVSQGHGMWPRSYCLRVCFNSLQTGKCISSERLFEWDNAFKSVSIPFKRESVSQDSQQGVITDICICVSIPFKRESVSQGNVEIYNGYKRNIVSIPFKRESVSQDFSDTSVRDIVALFQFPSNGKVYLKRDEGDEDCGRINSFNSLQTGKCISRLNGITRVSRKVKVSIPFKRESVSQG